MKRNFLCYIFILLILLFENRSDIYSQNISNQESIWTKTYPNDGLGEYSRDIKKTSDGGFVILGYTLSGKEKSKIFLMKINSYGNLLWKKEYRSEKNAAPHSIQQTSDGGFIILGYTFIMEMYFGDDKLLLIKTDLNGNLLWQKEYDKFRTGHTVQQTSDGGFIILGRYENILKMGRSAIIKTDINGNIIWLKNFDYFTAWDIQQTDDENYIIGGYSECNIDSNNNLILDYISKNFLAKINNDGEIIWFKTYKEKNKASAFTTSGLSVKKTQDNGFCVVGSINTKGHDIYILKTDNEGKYLWSSYIGTKNFDRAHDFQETSDGGYIAVGLCDIGFYGAGAKIFIVKFDSNGKKVFEKVLKEEGSKYYFPLARSMIGIQIENDDYFVIAGSIDLNGKGIPNIFLIKTNLTKTDTEKILF